MLIALFQIKENIHMLLFILYNKSNEKGIRTYPPVLQNEVTYVLTNPPKWFWCTPKFEWHSLTPLLLSCLLSLHQFLICWLSISIAYISFAFILYLVKLQNPFDKLNYPPSPNMSSSCWGMPKHLHITGQKGPTKSSTANKSHVCLVKRQWWLQFIHSLQIASLPSPSVISVDDLALLQQRK